MRDGSGHSDRQEQKVPRERALRDVEIMAERLAMLYYHFARVLVEELGEERARELIARAIEGYGTECGRRVREGVLAMGKPLTPENYSLVPDLPSLGWEVAGASADEKEIRAVVSHCPLAAYWKHVGAEKLARLYCFVDQAKYSAYNSDLKCKHVRNVLDGDAACEIHVTSSHPQ